MPSLAQALADLLRTVDRPGSFYAAGTAELLPPSLEVEGVGPVALPLLPVQAGQLITAAEPAPFGRGQDTIVDPAMRRCWQVGHGQVRIGGRHWARTLDGIVARAADGLGVTGPVTAEFYKLLLYGEGGFFVGHRDTEKAPGMFATLVVVLPSMHEGGNLVVRHAGQEARLTLSCDDPAEVVFAAFYADCVHEVLPVTAGFRLTLVYNLVRPGGRAPKPPDHWAEQARAAALLREWDENGPVKLVLPLQHAYTLAELGFPALKGADAAVAGVLAAAVPQARCDLNLALLTVEEHGPAEYTGGYGWRRGGPEDDEDSFEVVEVSNRDVALSDWRSPDGGAPAIGPVPVDEEEELSPPGACDDLVPDEQSFREATGNEGASFERTYRRAALVLWPSGRLAAVLAQAGTAVTLPYLEDLVRQWATAGGNHASPLWGEAHELAREMLKGWPACHSPWSAHGEGVTSTARMLAALSALGDDDLIRQVLAGVIAAGGHDARDADAVLDALCRLPPPDRAALVERIVQGTAGAAFTACVGLLARAAAWGPAGLHGAAAALVEAMPGDPARASPAPSWQRPAPVTPGAVLNLLAGLSVVDPALTWQAAAHMLAWPGTYGMDAVLVPAARELSPGAPGADILRAACLAHLRARAAEPLTSPADWRRDSTLPCRCPRCTELARFLDDPEQRTWVLKAAEADRSHVEGTIRTAGCDLDTVTDRRGRPYSLVCTKTQASYERRARQRKQDLADLVLLAG